MRAETFIVKMELETLLKTNKFPHHTFNRKYVVLLYVIDLFIMIFVKRLRHYVFQKQSDALLTKPYYTTWRAEPKMSVPNLRFIFQSPARITITNV